jgi:hypothetical protein
MVPRSFVRPVVDVSVVVVVSVVADPSSSPSLQLTAASAKTASTTGSAKRISVIRWLPRL